MLQSFVPDDAFIKTTSRIGDTLIVIQKTEALLKASIVISLGASEADIKLSKILAQDKLTLGMLLKEMNLKIELPDDFSNNLACFLKLRNLFVHNLFLQEWFDLKSHEGITKVNDFLQELLQKASVAIRIFVAYGVSFFNTELSSENSVLFNNLFYRIVASATSDFGDKSFEQYYDEFSKELENKYNLEK